MPEPTSVSGIEQRLDILNGSGMEPGIWNKGASPVYFYRRRGRDPVLLCLHGLGDSSLTFPEFLKTDALIAYSVVAPDIPGFGQSPRRESATRTLAGQATAILELLNALEADRFVVLGHSMGGAVGVHLAETAPDRCLGILSLEGNLTPDDCTLSAEAVDAEMAGSYPTWRDEVVPRLRHAADAGEEGISRFLMSFHHADPASYLEGSHALVEESSDSELGKRYAALTLPRLFLHGGRSSSPNTRTFVREKGLEEFLHPDSGHWPHWDARNSVAEACGEFLKGF